MRLGRMGELQASALEIYFFDPAQEGEFDGAMTFDGAYLTIHDRDAAFRALTDRANSLSDDDHDMPMARAVQALASRVLRAK